MTKYVIDIVGTCNLKCPSCGRREHYGYTPSYKGLMDFDLFCKVLDKIRDESPGERHRIVLYNWGEPLMHNRIGDIVAAINSRGFEAQISTNGNATKHLEAAIKAKPAVFAISLSGFTKETYEKTHRLGDIDTVTSSIFLAWNAIQRYSPDTQFVIHYHLYKDNGGENLATLKRIVEVLDCDYNVAVAQLIALDDHLDALAGKSNLSKEKTDVLDKMIFSPAEWREMGKEFNGSCPQIDEDRVVVYADGSVRLCCNVMGDKYTLFPSFLDVTKEQIFAARRASDTCGVCMAAGFHNGWAVSDHSRTFRDGVNAAMKTNGGDRYVAVVSLGYRNHTAIKGLLFRHIQRALGRRISKLIRRNPASASYGVG